MITVQVRGLRELGEALKKLPKEIASKSGGPLAFALRKAANVIRDEAKNLCPVDALDDDGVHLRDSIKTRRDTKARDVTERMVVKSIFSKSAKVPRNYFHFVEFGTEKSPAHPFMRPAFENKKDDALNTFVQELSKGIDRAAKKVAKGKVNRGR